MNHSLDSALLIAVISLVTILLRALPFGIFGDQRKVPKVILYLGEVLPSAVLGMLVVYCLKDLKLTEFPYGLQELLACGAVVLMQVWKKNTIYSILTGTLLYMLLLHI